MYCCAKFRVWFSHSNETLEHVPLMLMEYEKIYIFYWLHFFLEEEG